MVLANDKQNSGLVNFVLKSCLPFVQIRSIYPKTASKAWNWYQRWMGRNGIWISVWKILSGKTGLPFQMFRCSRKFSAWTTQEVVLLIFFQPDFPETFCKMVNSVYVFFFSNINWQVILVFWKWVIIIKIKFPCLSQLLQIYSFWHIILISKHRCFNYKLFIKW